MSETKLLPCPFCGREAKIANYDWRYTIKEYWVYCGCGCDTKKFKYKESAIEAWNTRKPIDDIVERLEKVKEKEQPEINGKTTIRDLQVFKMTLGYVIDIICNAGKEVRNDNIER